jgi:3-methyladenine DNA glycosylase AlkD
LRKHRQKQTQSRTRAKGARAQDAGAVVALLERLADKKTRDGMARYGLPSDKAFGVPVSKIQKLAKQVGRSHALAEALWKTGWYEARMLAAYVDEPEQVTPQQMDRWCADFDNWGIVDTVCFVLFDRSPHAWSKVAPWSKRSDEFGKRAGFVLLACLAAHDKRAEDKAFAKCLPLVERGAQDERNFVKKGVSWALRMVGRRSRALNAQAVAVARRLTESLSASAQWVGKVALKELTSPAVVRRLNG